MSVKIVGVSCLMPDCKRPARLDGKCVDCWRLAQINGKPQEEYLIPHRVCDLCGNVDDAYLPSWKLICVPGHEPITICRYCVKQKMVTTKT